jgi:hypothetical protein
MVVFESSVCGAEASKPKIPRNDFLEILQDPEIQQIGHELHSKWLIIHRYTLMTLKSVI